jgi:thiol-disulfide isomerase/thioredoxin
MNIKINYKIILAIIISSIFIWFLLKKNSKEQFEENNSNIKVLLFKADFCGHCKQFLPIFLEFKKKVESENLPVDIKILDGDSDDEETQKLMKENGIDGFPSTLFIKDNKVTKYNGDRTVNGLMTQLNTLLN